MPWPLFLLAGCAAPEATATATASTPAATPAALTAATPAAVTATSPAPAADPISAWMDAPLPVADGFDPPGVGWSDRGDGAWTRTEPGPVATVAAGVLRAVDGDTLVTEHLWYDDQIRRSARLTWRGVHTALPAGTLLSRGQVLGTTTHGSLSGPAELGPIPAFVAGRPRLPVPQAEPVLAVIAHDTHQLRLYAHGTPQATYEIALGQQDGDKARRGDNRTPKGVYFVVAQSTGPFDGPYGAFYGGHWTKLGYPNAWDAARGVDAGLIGVDTQRSITRAYWARREPAQGTKLGGGIGIHGWAAEWEDDGPRTLSWGCVVVHLRDVAALYAALPPGTMVALI